MNRREFLKGVGKLVVGLSLLPILPKEKEWTFNVPKYNPNAPMGFSAFVIEGKAISDHKIAEAYRISRKLYGI